MSYYRRTQRRTNSWRTTPQTESVLIHSKAAQSAYEFVLNKFFSFTPSEFDRYSAWYLREHGVSARDYLQKTYSSWKNHSTRMSTQTASRVLAGVPKIMSRAEQFHLLQFYLPGLLLSPRANREKSIIDSSNLSQHYMTIVTSISAKSYDVPWFVSSVFSPTELALFQNVIRYILLLRLESSFVGVQSDLILLHNALRDVQADVTLQYQIEFLGLQVSVGDVHLLKEQQIQVALPILTADDLSQPELRAILADTAMTDSLKVRFSAEVQSIGIDDLRKVSQQVETIAPDMEMDSQIGVTGKGGIAQIWIVKRSVSKMKYRIALSYGWLVFVSILVTIVAQANLTSSRPNGLLLLIGGFIACTVIITLIQDIKEIKSKLKEYEHRRSQVFASDKHN